LPPRDFWVTDMVKPFEIDKRGHVALMWLAAAERKNAMGPEFWAELPGVVQALDEDEGVRAVVVAARGPAFSVGLDLVRMAAELGPALLDGGLAAERNALFRKVLELRRGFDAVVESNKPFVAAVHGWCIGGGLDFVSACDVRVASATARFSLREAKIAIVADMGSLQRLEGVVGRGHLRELAFTGKDIDAERALRIGLVNDVLQTDEAALAAAVALAEEMAHNSPLAVQGTKEALRMTARHGEEVGLRYVAAWNAAHLASEDLREAMTAFVEKRKPIFKGR
jgi:enoyl-CoA hydratase